MNFRYIHIGAAALMMLCMLTMVSCGGTSTDGWGKKRTFNQEEYDRAYEIYLDHFDDDIESVPLLNAIADSLFKSGNYAVQVNALMMKVIACTITDSNDSISLLYHQAMDIAKANGNQHLYFSVYNNFCQDLFERNAAAAMRETKAMFDEANELNSPTGRKNGHRMLGNILQYYHSNSASAIKEYLQAEAIADSMKSSPVYMFDLHMEMATAYASNNQQKEALEILDKAKESEMFADEYFQMSYNITRLAVMEKTATAEEYNDLYNKVFNDASALSRFTDEQLKDWNVRLALKNKRFDEAAQIISEMEKADNRQSRTAQLYAAKDDYRNAYDALDRLIDVRDSLRYEVDMNDIISMETQLHNAELKKQADEAKSQRRLVALIAIATLLIFVVVSAIVFIYRQKVANRKLAEANDIKVRFMQNMSHELRTPINHVSGFAQLMDSGACDDDTDLLKEATHAIARGTEAITEMVENITLIIELDTDNTKLETREVNVEACVNESIDCLRIDKEKNLKLIRNINLPAGFTMQSNDIMIKQVIRNLLSNAVKFTHEGSITIDVCLDAKILHIIVTDTGCGIAPEHREAIFDRFFKINEFVPGTGLGLPVCRMLAERLHGSLELDTSYKGAGSRFVFTLPA